MASSTLYDEDVLAWSEQQVEALRALARGGRPLPNDLDLEHVIEEIEGVGLSELAAARSFVEFILVHAVKLRLAPDTEAARHWQGEIIGFAAELHARFAPSMRQRIALEKIWSTAVKRARLGVPEARAEGALPQQRPFTLDELAAGELEPAALVIRIGAAMPERP